MESNLQINPFSRSDFFRKVWRLALPISIQAMMFSVLGLVDIMMVSHLGEISVAAVGYGNRIFFFNLIAIVAFGSAMSVLVAQYVGAGQTDGIRRSLVHTLISSVVLTVPFVAVYLAMPKTVVELIGDDPELVSLAVEYLVITAPSFFCTALVVPLEALLRASNDAKAPTRIGFLTIIVNVVLNYVFIFGALGIPAMGVAGSALGTTLARLFQTILVSYYLYKAHPDLLPSWLDIRAANTLRRWRKYMDISFPMLFQDALWSFGLIIYSLIYASMGVNELAVMTTIASVEAVMISMFIGFAIAASIILGNELGANQFHQAWQESWYFMLLAPVAALIIGFVIYMLDEQALMVFGKFENDSLIMAHQVLITAAFALSVRVIGLMGIVGVLRSGGDVKATAMINIIGMWCVGIPMAWMAVNVWHLPLYLVFICALMEEITKAVLVLARITSKHWLRNLIVAEE